MQVPTNYEQGLSFHYEKAEQVPQQCLIAAKILESQPLFDGSGSIVKRCKVIPLESRDVTRIFAIFNRNAIERVGNKTAWHIHDFGGGNNQLYTANGCHIKRGLNLWLYDGLGTCSLETLEKVYSDVYNSMRKGWIQSNPEEYQCIMFKEDTEKFVLFVKKNYFIEEATLIKFLINKFELQGQIECDSNWLKDDVGNRCNDTIYMWIDKKEISKIIEKFGFEI